MTHRPSPLATWFLNNKNSLAVFKVDTLRSDAGRLFHAHEYVIGESTVTQSMSLSGWNTEHQRFRRVKMGDDIDHHSFKGVSHSGAVPFRQIWIRFETAVCGGFGGTG